MLITTRRNFLALLKETALNVSCGLTATAIYSSYNLGKDNIFYDDRVKQRDKLMPQDLFESAIWAWENNFRYEVFMPRFSPQGREVRTWRHLCRSDPRALELLLGVVKHPEAFLNEQKVLSFLLLSSLATSEDEDIQKRALGIIHNPRNKNEYGNVHSVPSYDQYMVVRTYLFAVAEAEGKRNDDERCRDFIEAHHPKGTSDKDNWELLFNKDYYNDPSIEMHKQRVNEKLEHPQKWEANIAKCNQWHLDNINKYVQRYKPSVSADRVNPFKINRIFF